MPNWVYNRLTANAKVIDSCLNSKRLVSFNTLLPMPDALDVSTVSDKDLIRAYSEYLSNDDKALRKLYTYPRFLDGYKTFEDFLDYISSTVTLEEVAIHSELMSRYHVDNWYDWCCKYWGTKWDASSDFICDEGYPEGVEEIEFQTAWSPPEAWFSHLVETFPDEEISMHFDEESCGFSGSFHSSGSGTYSESSEDPEYYTPYVMDESEFDSSLKDYDVKTINNLNDFLNESLPNSSYTVEYNTDSSGITATVRVESTDYSYTKIIEHLKEEK